MRKVQIASNIKRAAIAFPSTGPHLYRGFRVKALSEGIPYVPDSDLIFRQLPSLTDTLLDSPGDTDGAAKDIIVDDLRATIEAHRATNVRRIIHRRVAKHGYNDTKRIAGSSKIDASEPASDIHRKVDIQNVPRKIPEKRNPGGTWALDDSNIDGNTYSERPWLDHLQSHGGDAPLRLCNEIKAFETYMRPTSTEAIATQRLINEVTKVTSAALPKNPISIHGSRYTGLAGPLSDIDFSLALPEYEKDPSTRGPSSTRPQARQAGRRVLKHLFNMFDAHKDLYTSVALIPARKPIFTAIHCETGLNIQFITLASTLSTRVFTVNYLMEFPGLRPVFIVLRHCLQIRNLTTVTQGGVGSYTLFIMVVTALKCAPGIFAPDDLAGQLLHVLDFYANADFFHKAYSADPPRVFAKSLASTCSVEPYVRNITTASKSTQRLCLLDPADRTNDLGANTCKMTDIKSVFADASHRLRTNMTIWESLDDPARQGWDQGILDPLVRANYEHFELARSKLASSGCFKISKRLQRIPLIKFQSVD